MVARSVSCPMSMVDPVVYWRDLKMVSSTHMEGTMKNLAATLALLALVICTFVGVPVTVVAGPTPQGSVIIRVDDTVGQGRCIGPSDQLTVTLRRPILEKKSKWLGLIQDTELVMTLTTTVSGSGSEDVKSASFAKVIKESVSQFSTGQISLAQEQNLLNRFALTNGTNTFSVVDLEVGIVRTQGRSVGAQILLGAVDATKSLQLPTNPFTTAYNVATTYVNSVFSPLLDQAASQQEAVIHHITMNIDAGGCTGDDERTGTKAIIDAVDDPTKPGYVDTSKIDNYCFKAILTPAFVLKFAPLPAGGSCGTVTNYVDLQNSYLAFYVNSVPPGSPKPNVNAVAALKLTTPAGDNLHVLSSKGLRSAGFPTDAADSFSKAMVSKANTADIAGVFRVTSQWVEAYRESLNRCLANGTPADRCF